MMLATEDRKILKYEKRVGRLLSMSVLAFGAVLNLLLFVSDSGPDLVTVIVIDCVLILAAWLVVHFVNRKLNRDLAEGIKTVSLKKVVEKVQETSWEAGSGSLYIPILGDLFPKLWNQEPRGSINYYFVIDGYKHDVSENTYKMANEGSFVEMYFAPHSETLLGIETHEPVVTPASQDNGSLLFGFSAPKVLNHQPRAKHGAV